MANAGLLLLVALAHHLGLGGLVESHVDLGNAPGRTNAGDKLLTLRGTGARLRGQAAIHPWDFPAEFPVGPGAPTGPGEQAVADPSMGGWGRTWQ